MVLIFVFYLKQLFTCKKKHNIFRLFFDPPYFSQLFMNGSLKSWCHMKGTVVQGPEKITKNNLGQTMTS